MFSKNILTVARLHRDRQVCDHQRLFDELAEGEIYGELHQLLGSNLRPPNPGHHHVEAGPAQEGVVWASCGQNGNRVC